MATSSTPTPNPYKIPGAISLNTTGYPTPTQPNQGQAIQMLKMAPGPLPAKNRKITAQKTCVIPAVFETYPSHAELEFSVADLQFLGDVTEVCHLVFEMTFIKPGDAKVKEFKLEIASPDRKKLFQTSLDSEGCIQHNRHTTYTFSLNAKDVRRAQPLFLPGNRFIVHAKVSRQIIEGKLQVAVRKYL